MNELPALSPWWLAALAATTLFNTIFPIALAIFLIRRLGEKLKFVLYGAIIFLLFQLLTRVPLVIIAGQLLGPILQESLALRWVWVALLALTAGLSEEIGRSIGYRWLMPNDARTWEQGVLYGVGHGGFEAVILVGFLGNFVSLINLVLLQYLDPALIGVTAEQQQLVAQQLTALAAQPWWFPLLGAWERLWTIPLHVALSLMVLQVFWRNQQRWLWYAVTVHTAVNFVAAGVLPLLGVGMLWIEGLIALVGLGALWMIQRFRQVAPSAPVHRV